MNFVYHGFWGLIDVRRALNKHQSSELHEEAALPLSLRPSSVDDVTDILSKMNASDTAHREQQGRYLTSVIKALNFLAKQNITLCEMHVPGLIFLPSPILIRIINSIFVAPGTSLNDSIFYQLMLLL